MRENLPEPTSEYKNKICTNLGLVRLFNASFCTFVPFEIAPDLKNKHVAECLKEKIIDNAFGTSERFIFRNGILESTRNESVIAFFGTRATKEVPISEIENALGWDYEEYESDVIESPFEGEEFLNLKITNAQKRLGWFYKFLEHFSVETKDNPQESARRLFNNHKQKVLKEAREAQEAQERESSKISETLKESADADNSKTSDLQLELYSLREKYHNISEKWDNFRFLIKNDLFRLDDFLKEKESSDLILKSELEDLRSQIQDLKNTEKQHEDFFQKYLLEIKEADTQKNAQIAQLLKENKKVATLKEEQQNSLQQKLQKRAEDTLNEAIIKGDQQVAEMRVLVEKLGDEGSKEKVTLNQALDEMKKAREEVVRLKELVERQSEENQQTSASHLQEQGERISEKLQKEAEEKFQKLKKDSEESLTVLQQQLAEKESKLIEENESFIINLSGLLKSNNEENLKNIEALELQISGLNSQISNIAEESEKEKAERENITSEFGSLKRDNESKIEAQDRVFNELSSRFAELQTQFKNLREKKESDARSLESQINQVSQLFQELEGVREGYKSSLEENLRKNSELDAQKSEDLQRLTESLGVADVLKAQWQEGLQEIKNLQQNAESVLNEIVSKDGDFNAKIGKIEQFLGALDGKKKEVKEAVKEMLAKITQANEERTILKNSIKDELNKAQEEFTEKLVKQSEQQLTKGQQDFTEELVKQAEEQVEKATTEIKSLAEEEKRKLQKDSGALLEGFQQQLTKKETELKDNIDSLIASIEETVNKEVKGKTEEFLTQAKQTLLTWIDKKKEEVAEIAREFERKIELKSEEFKALSESKKQDLETLSESEKEEFKALSESEQEKLKRLSESEKEEFKALSELEKEELKRLSESKKQEFQIIAEDKTKEIQGLILEGERVFQDVDSLSQSVVTNLTLFEKILEEVQGYRSQINENIDDKVKASEDKTDKLAEELREENLAIKQKLTAIEETFASLGFNNVEQFSAKIKELVDLGNNDLLKKIEALEILPEQLERFKAESEQGAEQLKELKLRIELLEKEKTEHQRTNNDSGGDFQESDKESFQRTLIQVLNNVDSEELKNALMQKMLGVSAEEREKLNEKFSEIEVLKSQLTEVLGALEAERTGLQAEKERINELKLESEKEVSDAQKQLGEQVKTLSRELNSLKEAKEKEREAIENQGLRQKDKAEESNKENLQKILKELGELRKKTSSMELFINQRDQASVEEKSEDGENIQEIRKSDNYSELVERLERLERKIEENAEKEAQLEGALSENKALLESYQRVETRTLTADAQIDTEDLVVDDEKLSMAKIDFNQGAKFKIEEEAKGLKVYKPRMNNKNNATADPEGRYNFSATGEFTEEGDDNKRFKFIKSILNNAAEKVGLEKEKAAIAILLALKYGGVSVFKDGDTRKNSLHEDLTSLGVSEDDMTKIRKFSAKFQHLARDNGLYTGNKDRIQDFRDGKVNLENLTPLRLKRLTANYSRDLFLDSGEGVDVRKWEEMCRKIDLTVEKVSSPMTPSKHVTNPHLSPTTKERSRDR